MVKWRWGGPRQKKVIIKLYSRESLGSAEERVCVHARAHQFNGISCGGEPLKSTCHLCINVSAICRVEELGEEEEEEVRRD